MPFEDPALNIDTASDGLIAGSRKHLGTVNETWAQHARMSLGFAFKFTCYAVRSLWCTITAQPIAPTPVGQAIKALAEQMATRNPCALKAALAAPVLKDRDIWDHMLRAALCAVVHALCPGAHCNSASVCILRAARGLYPDSFI
ncbi:MAG: hypothetical protein JO126_03095 [Alphaproteobacteria bacterium]|nr:hypothetical protein [Alphaproteobacteria bacterium]MBV8548427.1 hypothetical protein [Alphaproteobacteria bacterium]